MAPSPKLPIPGHLQEILIMLPMAVLSPLMLVQILGIPLPLQVVAVHFQAMFTLSGLSMLIAQ